MKLWLLIVGIVSVSASLLAQQPDSTAGSELTKLRGSYVDSLNVLLKQYVKNDDVMGAAAVSEELDKLATLPSVTTVDTSPCGRWDDWSGGPVTISPNGTTRLDGTKPTRGIWQWLDQAQGKRQIQWQSGYNDVGTISPDGTIIHVVTDVVFRFVAHRPRQAEKTP